MRQIELTVPPSQRADNMLVTEPLKQPLMNIALVDEHLEMKGGSIIQNTPPPVIQKVNTCHTAATEDISSLSARSSRSSSLNSYDTKVRVSNGPGYERKLLKKRLMVPEISIDNPPSSDDFFRIDDETRAKILDYKSDGERPGTIRKYSFNDKLKNLVISKKDTCKISTKEKSSTMKKLMKSPSLLRKSYSFKHTDSNVSSSAETTVNEQTEKRKKRKISIGKRRKTLKSQASKQSEENVEKLERVTKFRRRKLTKSQSESSLSSYNVNKSKVVLLYSGDSPIKHKNRLDTLKHTDSFDSSSECDDYSSGPLSDDNNNNNGAPKPRKTRSRGVAKRVWKSINSLFVSDDQSSSSKSFFSTPPLLRRSSTKSYAKYRSMPGGLNRVKSFSGHRSNTMKSNESSVKDDLCLLNKKKMSLDESSLATPPMVTKKLHKLLKISHERLNDEDCGTKRSKSLDFLLDTYTVRRKHSYNTEWFEPRKKAYSTLTRNEHMKKAARNGLQYKIIVSHEPKLIENQQKLEDFESSKIVETSAKSKDRRIDYMKVRLQDMKSCVQKEMETFLSCKRFKAEHVNDWCRTLSESVKERIVKITCDTHKIVAQVFIGALCDDGIHAAIQCTATNQSFFSVTYKGTDLFAVASVLTFEL